MVVIGIEIKYNEEVITTCPKADDLTLLDAKNKMSNASSSANTRITITVINLRRIAKSLIITISCHQIRSRSSSI